VVTAAAAPHIRLTVPATSSVFASPSGARTNRNRVVSARAAAFDATDRNAPTSAAAPVNTSGHQKWNGTAASLNPSPTSTHAAPTTTGSGICNVPDWAMASKPPVPTVPAIRLMP